MKSVGLACLLVIASVTASQPAENVPAQSRIVDYWLIHQIESITQWLKATGLDPVDKDIELDTVILNGLIEIEGIIEGLKFEGISNINIDNLYYNILLGRLDINFVIPKVWLQIDSSTVKVVYGGFRADLEVNGSLLFENIRIAGDALLRLSLGSVAILNINPNFRIGRIDADLTVLESGNDYSSWINNLLNVEIPGLLDTFKYEINTIIGELIRRAVNWRWPGY